MKSRILPPDPHQDHSTVEAEIINGIYNNSNSLISSTRWKQLFHTLRFYPQNNNTLWISPELFQIADKLWDEIQRAGIRIMHHSSKVLLFFTLPGHKSREILQRVWCGAAAGLSFFFSCIKYLLQQQRTVWPVKRSFFYSRFSPLYYCSSPKWLRVFPHQMRGSLN